ncbi:MAG: hypothetical protein ACRDMZ_22075, partial [Solirubrobacteraceae bacterium]
GQGEDRGMKVWNPLNTVADLAASIAGRLMRPKAVKPWGPMGWNTWAALHSISDYERCAAGASPAVKHVYVRAAANDERMPLGEVEVRAQGAFGRRLSEEDLAAVRRALVAHKPISVALRVISW